MAQTVFRFFFLQLLAASFFCSTSSAQKFSLTARFKENLSSITAMTADPQHHLLITGDQGGHIDFRDPDNGKLLKHMTVHQAPVANLRFNSNGRLLISSTFDGEIKIYDFEREEVIQGIYSPDYKGIRFVLFSIADGFVYFNAGPRLYKTRSDLTQHVDKVLEEQDSIADAVITNDRSSLIYATGTSLKVMNTRTDELRQEFNATASPIRQISLLGDSLLVTWSNDGSLIYWHYNLGQISPSPAFFFKAGQPFKLAFTPDGSRMISGQVGTWARIWNPSAKEVTQELFGHNEPVTAACFGLSSNVAFTGSNDGELILWRSDSLPPEPTPEVHMEPQPTLSFPDEPAHPAVEMAGENVPATIEGRKVFQRDSIVIGTSPLTLYVFDNSYIDGDTLSLFFNGKWILDHYGVTKQKKAIVLDLIPNTNNVLVLFANNLGKSPPNTAVVQFSDGRKSHLLRLSSDLHSCSALNLFYKP